jgi:hypothetical protein
MSDIETRKLWESENCKAEALMDGTPLKRPVYLRRQPGSYLSCEQAEALAAELTAAAAAARKAGSP